MLKITTSYVNRDHTNVYVKEQVNKKMKEAKAKPIETLTDFHRRTRIAYLCKLIVAGTTEPGTAVTFDPNTMEALDHGKKRVGKPRLNWYQVTLNDLWVETKKVTDSVKFASMLDIRNARHRAAIETYARTQVEDTQWRNESPTGRRGPASTPAVGAATTTVAATVASAAVPAARLGDGIAERMVSARMPHSDGNEYRYNTRICTTYITLLHMMA